MKHYSHIVITPCSLSADQLRDELDGKVTAYSISDEEKMYQVEVVSPFGHDRFVKSLFNMNVTFEEVITNHK